MNKDWHAKNKIPKSPTMDQRVRWHEEHARACGCRPIPGSVRTAIENQSRSVR
jgi:hypothetical protein